MRPTLIIDADDTLWETNIHYERCLAAFAELLEGQGFRREEVETTMQAVERERIAEVGYAPEEFIRSLEITYRTLCRRHGRPVERQIVESVWQIGQAVVDYPIVLFDGVADTLTRLSTRFDLLLLTKGDPETQEGKLARSGLAHFFQDVHVVAEKDAGVIRGLLHRYELRPEQTWIVGDSPRSDINPALEVGINAVYIPYSNPWDHEQEEILEAERVVVLESFASLAGLLLDDQRGQVGEQK